MTGSKANNPYKLTDHEIEMVKYLVNGYSNKEIGKYLNISATSISTCIANIVRKMKVRNRTECAVTWVREQEVCQSCEKNVRSVGTSALAP